MKAKRLLSWPLLVFAAVVAGSLGFAAYQAVVPPGLAAAVRQLGDRDCEHQERLQLLQTVLAAAERSREPEVRLLACMAAVALQDRGAYDRNLAELGRTLPVGEGDRDRLDQASLGEVVLRTLLQGMLAEAAGETAHAKADYRRVVRQCQLWDLPLAASLARERLADLG